MCPKTRISPYAFVMSILFYTDTKRSLDTLEEKVNQLNKPTDPRHSLTKTHSSMSEVSSVNEVGYIQPIVRSQ